MNTREKEDNLTKAIDAVMSKLDFERVTKSTDFHSLPESEWSTEELEIGHRMVAQVNADDAKRLDIFVQFKPIQYVTIACDFSF